MAKKTVFVSDVSGDEIEDGKGATVRVSFADGRRPDLVMDVTADEGAKIGEKGRRQAKRGRRPKEPVAS